MPTASNVTEVVMWTALPNGMTDGGDLKLSVFVSPQLSAEMSDASTPLLSLFPDFVDWPSTMAAGPVSFTVTFEGFEPVAATLDPSSVALDHAGWQAVFDPTITGVTPYAYEDLSAATLTSFNAATILDGVASLYGTIGAESPTSPVILSAQVVDRGTPTFGVYDNPTLAAAVGVLEGLTSYTVNGLPNSDLQTQIHNLRQFHAYPPTIPGVSGPDPNFTPSLPEIDFHQALSSLGSYPAVLRRFGLVFDLVVPSPVIDTNVTPGTVTVTPTWTSAFTGGGQGTTTNVSPLTAISLSTTEFRVKPRAATT